MMSEQLFTPEDEARTEMVIHTTVARIQDISEKEGAHAALAEAMGLSWGVAHVFKTLGLKELHRDLRKAQADFISRK